MTHPVFSLLTKLAQTIHRSIEDFQDHCPHKNTLKKHDASTGNYDPSNDCYWTNFHCLDCDKTWREEGSK